VVAAGDVERETDSSCGTSRMWQCMTQTTAAALTREEGGRERRAALGKREGGESYRGPVKR
jgi:hypothetical protein